MTSNIETVAVIPAYNEERTIHDVASAAIFAGAIDAVVVVDDGSSDRTAIEANEVQLIADNKHLEIVSHDRNKGKSEALYSGVKIAEEIGGSTLRTLVFLDADLSPISSRLGANKKLITKIKESVFSPDNTQSAEDPTFVPRLSNLIDQLARPVIAGDELMAIGLLERNIVADKLRSVLSWGAFGGNRAISHELWTNMLSICEQKNETPRGWEIEAAMNSYFRKRHNHEGTKLNRFIGKVMLDDVVNVGSGTKEGSLFRGLVRLVNVQTTSTKALVKYGRVFAMGHEGY